MVGIGGDEATKRVIAVVLTAAAAIITVLDEASVPPLVTLL